MQKPMTFKTSNYGFKNVRNDGNKEKPWEAMYRSLVIRLDEIVQNNESINSVELISTAHIALMSEYHGVPETEWTAYRGWRDG